MGINLLASNCGNDVMVVSEMKKLFYLGIDGGGTNCRARITDKDGNALGEATAGSANTRLGVGVAFNEIIIAANKAIEASGLKDISLDQIYAGLGLAGLALKSDLEKLLAYPHPFAGITAENDAYAACLGAHGGNDGGIFIFGTGSCGCLIIGGEAVYVGGWGFDISDDGSAAHVGLRALRRSLLAYDGAIEKTDLSREVMKQFDNSPEKAVLWASSAKPADYGTLAPLVSKCADNDDPLAKSIMLWSARGADRFLRALHTKGAKEIALVGGFSSTLEPWLSPDVREFLVPAKGDAMDGALIMAYRDFPAESMG